MKLFQCWSCQESFDAKNGVSVDNSEYSHICSECWTKIPVHSRLYLGFFFRSASDGGAGFREAMRRAGQEVILRDLFSEN